MTDVNFEKLNGLIDWYSCTFNYTDVQAITDQVCQLFCIDTDDLEGRTSAKGYQLSLFYLNYFSIHFDYDNDLIEKANRGIHLDITGQGCRFIESQNSAHTWRNFFIKMKGMSLRNVTRLDLALDDYHERLNIAELYKKCQNKELVSKLRKCRYMNSFDLTKGEEESGKTLYIGSPKRIQFRFYDKLQERLTKGFEVSNKITSWQRYEVQVRHEQAY